MYANCRSVLTTAAEVADLGDDRQAERLRKILRDCNDLAVECPYRHSCAALCRAKNSADLQPLLAIAAA